MKKPDFVRSQFGTLPDPEFIRLTKLREIAGADWGRPGGSPTFPGAEGTFAAIR